MSVTLCIPVYNCEPEQVDLLQTAVGTILQAQTRDAPTVSEIIVLDDCSPVPVETTDIDISALGWAHAAYHRRIIRAESNMGFTASVNALLPEVHTPWVVVANSDVHMKSRGWNKMLTSVHGLSSLLFPRPDPRLDWFPPGFFFGGHMDVFRKLGPLDERFEMFFSDSDYWVRAEREGVPLVCHRDIIVENARRVSVDAAIRNGTLGETIFQEDQQRFYDKWGGNPLHKGMLKEKTDAE